MKRLLPGICIAATAAVLFVSGQKTPARPAFPAYDIQAVLPRELSPGRYEQVQQRELQVLASEGWDLVSVVPYVYRNEEHGGDGVNPKPVVMQTYPAYFFRRQRFVPGQ